MKKRKIDNAYIPINTYMILTIYVSPKCSIFHSIKLVCTNLLRCT